MPDYEFRCNACRRRFLVFMTYSEYGQKTVSCQHCGSSDVQRRIGRIRIARSEESRLEGMDDMADLEGLEDDPRALGRMMRKMSSEMGEDLGPEFSEVVDRLEKGESPEDIEKAIPDLGNESAGGGDFGMDDF